MEAKPPSGKRMKTIDPLDFSRTFSVPVKSLSVIGIPSCLDRYPDTWSAAVRANWGIIVSFLSLAYCVLGQLIYFWTNIRHLPAGELFLEFANQIACTGFCTVGLLKLFMLSYHRNLLAEILTELGTWWDDKTLVPLQRIQNESQIRPNLNIVTVTTIANICMVSAFNLLPIPEMIIEFNQSQSWNRKLPYQIWFPWDPLNGLFYPVMYIFHVYSGLVVAVGNVGFDSIFCLLSAHISIQMNYLNSSIEYLVEDENLSKPIHLQRNLSNLIKLHQKLMEFKEPLESIFSIPFFVTFLGATVIICLQGILITTASSYVVAKYFMFLICILLEVYFLCHCGNEMLQSSSQIGTSTFHSFSLLTKFNESNSNKRIGKCLLIMIFRSQKSFQLIAWKCWPISVASFSKILNASWSYFSLLRALINK